MTVEIISVGTELLLGQVVDTNSAWLSSRLASIGVNLYRRTTVGDNLERMVQAITEALQRADGVILIGGLGPTEDDLTREAIAQVMGDKLIYDEEQGEHLKQLFAARGREATPKQLRQAMRPSRALAIPNPHGTAPGLRAEWDGHFLFALPGPPNEFQPMVETHVLPWLAKRTGGRVIHSRVLRLCGIGESDAESEIGDLLGSQNPTVAPLAKLGEVHLRITAQAETPFEAEQLIAKMERTIRERLGTYIFGVDETTLEQAVVALLRQHGQSFAVAESCTGGLLGKRITDVPGSSEVFLGGVIAYSNSAKHQLVGVPSEVLAAHGAVSEPTAQALAEGARKLFGSYWGIGITGIAGPGGGTPEKPVGLVYVGISDPQTTLVRAQVFLGDRDTVRWRASQYALWLLYRGVQLGGCASLLRS